MVNSVEELIRTGRSFSREDFVFFWRHTSPAHTVTHTCLSQWYPASFEVAGQEYSSAEQFMMAEKARIFGDMEVRRMILSCSDPHEIKKLGRLVKGFDSNVWDSHRTAVVVTGNMAKFGQNPKLRAFLLSTGDKILAEASPYDTIWGIGMAEDAPTICDPRTWRGLNLLGFALMQVRDELRQ